jgi:hypothetical protein
MAGWHILEAVANSFKHAALRDTMLHLTELYYLLNKALLYATYTLILLAKSLITSKQSTEALISCTPSFLDSPAWQSALNDNQTEYYHNNFYLDSLNAINRRVSRMSTVISECRSLDHRIRQKTHTVAEIRTVLKRYRNLRGEVQDHLERGSLMPQMETIRGERSIITMKLFLALLNLDAHIYGILYLLSLPSFSEEFSLQNHLAAVYTNGEEEPFLQGKEQVICPSNTPTSPHVSPDTLSPESPPFPSLMSNSLILNRLDASIAHSAISLKEQVLILRQANPFCTRRMSFLCHMVCAETRKRGAIHKAWGEMEAWFEGMNRAGCLL